MNDLATHDQDLCDAAIENSKRYSQIFADVIQELLPEFKEKEVIKEKHSNLHFIIIFINQLLHLFYRLLIKTHLMFTSSIV